MKIKTKITAFICIAALICSGLTGCGGKVEETDMNEVIMAQFGELTKIPRPSGHEEKISEYLYDWAESRGFDAVRDDYNNVIFDVPATKGFEALPTVALQCHMDMVFAQKDGLTLDPLTTVITAVSDGTYLRTDGRTSLGADDGIGIAIALCIADGKADHGPLRIIITTDEERTMSGTANIDTKYFADIDYLINVDSETEGELCVSSASYYKGVFTKEYEAVSATKEKAYEIRVGGLTGGHSGLDIDKNRLNGGMALGYILNTVKDEGVDFELRSVNGGFAENAIIYSASCVIFAEEADSEKLTDVVSSCLDTLKKEHSSTDPDMEITVSEIEPEDSLVLPESEKDAALTLLREFKNGIRSMSPHIEGLVECSSNLGIINAAPQKLEIRFSSRSSSAVKEAENLAEQKELADSLGYGFEVIHIGKSWEYKPGSKLEKVFCESYKKLFGTDMKVVAIHAGLECGTFAVYNDKLTIASVGPTIISPHSVDEKLETASVERVWRLLKEVLVNVD